MYSKTTSPYRKPECYEWATVPERMLAQSGTLEDFGELEDYTLA